MQSLVSLLPLLSLWLLSSQRASAAPDLSPRANSYCLPGQSCYPSARDWAAFNQTINGNLVAVTPFASSCFLNPGPYSATQCANTVVNYGNTAVRSDNVGATEYDNWMVCSAIEGDNSECVLPQPALPTPQVFPRSCAQGRVPPFAVRVTQASDVQAALKFAAARNLKIVTKNTGHDFLGRSTGYGGIMLWTHNLKSMTYSANFKGKNVPAATFGAGVQASEAYAFAKSNGKTITLGAYTSVGIAGGFAMGGGHGPLGPKYGLAVDNLLEFTIVTPDGQLRTADSNTNSDLFFALRGGGGGVWGTVLTVTYKLNPDLPTGTSFILAPFNPVTAAVNRTQLLAKFFDKLAELQPNWTAQGNAGYHFVYPDRLLLLNFLPGSDLAESQARMKPLHDYIKTSGDFVPAVTQISAYPTFDEARSSIFSAAGEGIVIPVGYSAHLESRHIPTAQFETPAARSEMANTMAFAFEQNLPAPGIDGVLNPSQTQPLMIYASGPRPAKAGGPSGADTGVNTSWRDMYWHVVLVSGWAQQVPQTTRERLRQMTHAAVNNLRKYGTGTYINEASTLEVDWKTAFFGGNYNRLLAIKKKYDPTNKLVVFKGIGYEGNEGETAFKCYNKA